MSGAARLFCAFYLEVYILCEMNQHVYYEMKLNIMLADRVARKFARGSSLEEESLRNPYGLALDGRAYQSGTRN